MSIVESLIGLLAPPDCLACGREGLGVCRACALSEILPHGERCWRCGGLSPASRTCKSCRWFGGPRYVWVSTDYAALAARMLKAYKFGHQRFMAKPLAVQMAETLETFNSPTELQKADYLLTFVPTATKRIRERGFDHTALLSREISKITGLPVAKLLRRHGQASQVGQRRVQRLKQSTENYSVASSLVCGRNILLIDDVLTTGATLRAATKVLRAAGAKHIDALVFAKRL